MNKCLYFTANEISEMLGVSRGHAYKIVKKLNNDLASKGYIVIAGKVPKNFCRALLWYGIGTVTKFVLWDNPQGRLSKKGE